MSVINLKEYRDRKVNQESKHKDEYKAHRERFELEIDRRSLWLLSMMGITLVLLFLTCLLFFIVIH